MHAPPRSRTRGEVHLTDNPADLDVITTVGRSNPSAQTHVFKQEKTEKKTQQAASDERGSMLKWGGGHLRPSSDFKCSIVSGRKNLRGFAAGWQKTLRDLSGRVSSCHRNVAFFPFLLLFLPLFFFFFFYSRFTLLRSETIVPHLLWDKIGVSLVLMALTATVKQQTGMSVGNIQIFLKKEKMPPWRVTLYV